MIGKLRLQNFKVFEDQEFEFQEGITTIVGPNGSGKTTILEAIEFAFFKNVSRKEKTIKTVEEFIRHGEKRCKIELEFVAPVNRREYRVVREIFPKKTVAELFHVGERKPIITGAKRVTEKITDLLGMDRHAFSTLIYVRQGEIISLSKMDPKGRRTSLYNMMGLGIYDKTDKDIGGRLRELKKQIENTRQTREQLMSIRDHLPSKQEVENALAALQDIESRVGDEVNLAILKNVIKRVMESVIEVETHLARPELGKQLQEQQEERELASKLKEIVRTIPDIAEEQLRPHIREETRRIFREIFGDRYSDLKIDDDYNISLFDLQGRRIPLAAASGGEDVCVNFSLRVAVNTALQKHSLAGAPPPLLILDEPGIGLDTVRKQWLPKVIAGLESIRQVIVVTHMDELREAADQVITLRPRGKGRQSEVIIE